MANMQYRKLGRTGLSVSEISLGSYLTFGASVDKKESIKIIRKALDLGINFFDTADSYANGDAERILGEALKNYDHDQFVISTKFFMPRNSSVNAKGLSRKNITESIHKSLKNLKLDYIDIALCHRFDLGCPLEETLSCLDDLVRRGDILYWGVSRWNSMEMQSACKLASERNLYKPICNQFFYNLLNREAEKIFATCEEEGLGIVAYSPLAQGVLTGKYLDTIPKDSRAANHELRKSLWHLNDRDTQIVMQLKKLADDLGYQLNHLALAWCLKAKVVSSVLVGAKNIGQIEDNIRALEINLDDEIYQKITRIITHATTV